MSSRDLRAQIYLSAVAVMAGCAGTAPPPERITIREPVRVEVPVPIPCEIEPALLAPVDAELPEFIATCAPASSGLTPEGESRLQALIANREQRIRAWRAWADGCRTPGGTEAPDH